MPAYLQIAELVSRQIDAGILADGQRLPPEREMAAAHGVSVGTLRKSLARLTEMGRLDRRQGSGNYIRQTDRAAAIYTMFRLERPDGGLDLFEGVRARRRAAAEVHGAAAHDGSPASLAPGWLSSPGCRVRR